MPSGGPSAGRWTSRIAELLVERAGDPPAMLKVTAEGDEIRLIHG